MSYQMIHLQVAYSLLSSLPDVKNQSDFLLGSVAPDAVHMDEDFTIEAKIHSHLFEGCGEWADTKYPDKWKDNILSFWNRYRDSGSVIRDFALGYTVHCLTDRCNDQNIWVPLRDENQDCSDYAAFRERFQYEARHIDIWLEQTSRDRDAIRELLAAGRAYDLEDYIKAGSLEKQRYHLLYEQYDCDKVDADDFVYVTKEKIENFLKTTVEEIIREIKG